VSDLRIGDILARNAASRPNALAVIDPHGVSLSWAELDAETGLLAAGLAGLGLGRGARVATILRNGPGAIEALFALAKPGFIGVPINYGLTPAEVATILKDSEPQAILVDEAFLSGFEAEIRASGATLVVRGRAPVGGLDYDTLKERGGRFDADAVRAGDVRTIRYTSGTTAAPKGCIGTHRQILSSIENFSRELALPEAPFLQLLPLFSGAGIWMAFAAAFHGLPNVVHESFKPAEALSAIAEYGVGHACGVPTMLSRLCNEYEAGHYNVSSLKLFGYTGSPMPPSVIRKALTLLPWRFYQGFGGGEMGGLVSYLKPEDHPQTLDDEAGLKRLASVGRPAKYAELRIRNLETAEPVAPGEIGEISVRSPSNFSGYHNRPEETAGTLRGEWVHTGDVGYLDETGLLFVVDRVKDMVLTGGMNVSSAEVENVLMEHPAVKLAAVVGIPDTEWGELVTGVVTLKDGAAVTEPELIAFARQRLAGYKAPKMIKFLDSLPMNSAGKILKRDLRKQFSPAAT
jgi:acyl-CoA synthetase (AMP-forming)/AMP-acid ligase II